MKRLISTLSIIGAGLILAGFEAPAATRPNILFLFSDDQRAETIHALGNPHIQTPNLDQLVAQGTVFTRAYCMGAQQGAVCVPSRAMLLTGRTLFRIKENLQGQTTWPEQFTKAGYTTFISGKWHNGGGSVTQAFAEGKAIFLGGMTQQNVAAAVVQDMATDRSLVNKRAAGKFPSELFADCAVEFLRRQNGEKPFLCYVPFNLPHDPRVAPKEFHDLYNADKPPAPANFVPQHLFNNGEMTVRDEQLAPWPRTPDVVRQHLADYYAAITFLDAQIGRIVAALKASGQFEKTIIAFSSDHGLAIGSHGLFGKQNLYEHSMRVPLILAGPGIPKNQRTGAFCYLLDIFPTLGALAGVGAPEGNEGNSLVPVISGKEEQVRDSVFTAYRGLQRAVRDEQWKLIRYPEINFTQLFDLINDPQEMKNLAEDPKQADRVKALTTALAAWQTRLGDSLPLSSDNPKPRQIDLSKPVSK